MPGAVKIYKQQSVSKLQSVLNGDKSIEKNNFKDLELLSWVWDTF